MKKQNNNKLAFTKNGIVELNNNELLTVNGGTVPLVIPATWIAEAAAAASSAGCAAAAAAAAGAVVGAVIAAVQD